MATNKRKWLVALLTTTMFFFSVNDLPKAIDKQLPPTQSAQQTTQMETDAMTFLRALQNGSSEEINVYLSAEPKQQYPNQALLMTWRMLTQSVGLLNLKQAQFQRNDGVHTHIYVAVDTRNGLMNVDVKMNQEGKVDEFMFVPGTEQPSADAPSYADPSKYTEVPYVVGKGSTALPGKLTVPKGEGPFPVVILVHGSGPNDMDEHIAGARPFRDLAYGLATQGIAVLRYDKRTYTHPLKFSADPNFTVFDETTQDANIAAAQLQKDPRFNSKQIFVLGHSLGAMMAPQILKDDQTNAIAGAILLAGPARSFPTALIDQLDYLYQKGQVLEAQYKLIREQYELLRDPKFSAKNPPSRFILGSVPYWDSIRKINPATMAARQTKPLLILQGERDFQVLANKEIPVWKAKLAKRKNVQIQTYSKINHLFTESDGQMTVAEYNQPRNVAPYIITDIVKWLKGKK
ncbi:MAG: alpha/beta hydrolase family protein [Bacilli bacterium]